MVDKVVVEEDGIVDDDVDLEFEEGFIGKPTEKSPPAAGEPPEGAEVLPEGGTEPEIKYHQLTSEQWESLQTLSTQIDSVRAEGAKWRDTAFGKVGGLERTIQQLQAATPAGIDIEVTDDIVAEITEEYPELGGRVLAAFKKLASKIKGTGQAVQQPAASTTDVESHIQKEVQTRLVALQLEALEDAYPTWREVTGAPDSSTPYRQWLAKQPADYQHKLGSTNSAAVIGRSIEKFEKEAAEAARLAEATKAPTRKEQLAAAAVTRGAGGRTPTTTDDDEFEAGYNSA